MTNTLGIDWNHIGPLVLGLFFIVATIIRVGISSDNSKKKK